jgi:hypothetical protein
VFYKYKAVSITTLLLIQLPLLFIQDLTFATQSILSCLSANRLQVFVKAAIERHNFLAPLPLRDFFHLLSISLLTHSFQDTLSYLQSRPILSTIPSIQSVSINPHFSFVVTFLRTSVSRIYLHNRFFYCASILLNYLLT